MQTSQDVYFLLQLCKNYLQQENLTISEESIEGANLFALARQHRITIPLAPKLIDWFKSNDDTESVMLLKEYNQKAKMNMLKYTQEIIQLLKTFEKLDLLCFCLKGPVSAQHIFGDYTAKDSRDIDLLIDESKLESYIELIQERGYSLTFDFQQLNDKQKRYFRKINNQLVFFHPEKRILLEIHWRLFANDKLLSLSYEELISNSQTITIANHPISVFSNEHLLFYLVTHGAKHKWSKLYWLLEIAKLVQQEDFNWDLTLHKAQEQKIDRMLFQAFALIEEFFDIRTPFVSATNKKTTELANEAKQEIFNLNSPKADKNPKNYWAILKYKLKLKNGLSYKLNYFHFISIQDFKLLPLPKSLFSLYYICRPFLWAKRYLFIKAG